MHGGTEAKKQGIKMREGREIGTEGKRKKE